MMDAIKIHDLARRLHKAHGESSLAEAARKAVSCEKEQDQEQAQIWRRIEAALRERKGPHFS
jgi:hypothetical protein